MQHNEQNDTGMQERAYVFSYEILHRSGTMRWSINIFVHSQTKTNLQGNGIAPSSCTRTEVEIEVSELITALNFTLAY
jgi:hypothetical protein